MCLQENAISFSSSFNDLTFDQQIGVLTIIIAIVAIIFSIFNVISRVILTNYFNKRLEKKKYAEKKYEKIGLLISKFFLLERNYKNVPDTKELEAEINSLFMELAIYLPNDTYHRIYDSLIDLEKIRDNIPDLINYLRKDFRKDNIDIDKIKLLEVQRKTE